MEIRFVCKYSCHCTSSLSSDDFLDISPVEPALWKSRQRSKALSDQKMGGKCKQNGLKNIIKTIKMIDHCWVQKFDIYLYLRQHAFCQRFDQFRTAVSTDRRWWAQPARNISWNFPFSIANNCKPLSENSQLFANLLLYFSEWISAARQQNECAFCGRKIPENGIFCYKKTKISDLSKITIFKN